MDLLGFRFNKIRLALLLAFSFLMLFQVLIGFRDFEDYLIAFVFVLFLNDLHAKIKKPIEPALPQDRMKRLVMSVVFLILFILPFVLDSLNITDAVRSFIYRLGFILWAQVFLLDAFINYRQTHSRKWLVITNMAALLIVVGAFIN